MTRDISNTDAAINNFSDLQLAYQRLLALERFKSGFLARTSHELRSPINTIVSLHQLILEDLCEGPEEEKEFIGKSKDAALKMLALFDQIAAVSKLDIGREPSYAEAVDLSFLLPEVEMLTTLQAANQNVRYTVESPTNELMVQTDAKWLKNILLSLIQDAIGHTKTLRLTIEQDPQAIISVVIECDRPAAQLRHELDSVAQAADQPLAANTDLSTSLPTSLPTSLSTGSGTPPIDRIQLSTGLILATAHTALPLINGQFAITTCPTSNDRSCLRCSFSST